MGFGGQGISDNDHHERRGHHNDEGEEEFWEEIHEVSTHLNLILVFIHILGVIVSSRLYNENLVRAMITGKKQRSAEE